MSEESFAGANEFVKPGAQWSWEGNSSAGLDSTGYASPGVMMVQVGWEFDLDMGGDRASVEVDGVQGWFTRLSSEDFHPPTDGSPYLYRNEELAGQRQRGVRLCRCPL